MDIDHPTWWHVTGNQQHTESDQVPVKDKYSLVGTASQLMKSCKRKIIWSCRIDATAVLNRAASIKLNYSLPISFFFNTFWRMDTKWVCYFLVILLTVLNLFASHICRTAFVDKLANSCKTNNGQYQVSFSQEIIDVYITIYASSIIAITWHTYIWNRVVLYCSEALVCVCTC